MLPSNYSLKNHIYKQDFALDSHQRLICTPQKTKKKKTSMYYCVFAAECFLRNPQVQSIKLMFQNEPSVTFAYKIILENL